MFRILWIGFVLTMGWSVFVSHAWAQSTFNSQVSNLQATLTFDEPQSALHFIVPDVLFQVPQSTDGGYVWHYALNLTKAGGSGKNESGQPWALLQRPLTLPIEALKARDKFQFTSDTLPLVKSFSQTFLLGAGWQTLSLTPFNSTLYFTRLGRTDPYRDMTLALLNALKAWPLPTPLAYPDILIQEHQHPQTVFSGVNHGKELVFLVPEKAGAEVLFAQGAQVMGHELLHLYTGKGEFSASLKMLSQDPILKEGFLTYGGLVLAKEALLISQAEFKTALQQFQQKASESDGVALRPAQPENRLWVRKAYFQGALLAHAITQRLEPVRFSQLFKVLVNQPTAFGVEQLSEIIKANFQQDLEPLILEHLEK